MAGLFAGLGLFGLRLRKFTRGLLAVTFAAASLSVLSGAISCTGRSGLAMTPGRYTYVIHAATPPDVSPGMTSSTNIFVRVNCDSCP
jgi:hypothetical protein